MQEEGVSLRGLPRSLTGSRYWWRFLNHDRDWGLEDDVDQFVKSWKSLKGKPDAQVELINTRRSQAEEIQKHAILCRQWEKDRVAFRAEELNQLKRDRFQSALDRLRQLGWGEELDRLAPLYKSLSQYDPLRAAQKLTDRIWHNIGGGVVTILEDIRDERRRVRHTEILRKRLDALCTVLSEVYPNPPMTVETEYKPRICDMIEMPEVREIIHSSNDPTLGSENEEKLRALFPNLMERWQAETREELRRRALRWVECVDGADILTLAATHFACSKCLKLLPYPEILGHKCLRVSAPTYRGHPYNQYCVYAIAAWEVGVNSRPWNGQDGENCVITLRTAVEEEWTRWMSGSYDKTLEYKGRVATEPELAAAKKNGQERLWKRHQFIWCCSLCTPRGDYLDQARNTCLSMIRDHMKETHHDEDVGTLLYIVYWIIFVPLLSSASEARLVVAVTTREKCYKRETAPLSMHRDIRLSEHLKYIVYEAQREPMRSIYIALQAAHTCLILTPLWVISSIPRMLRPRPWWSAYKTFALGYVRYWSVLGSVVERAGPITKEPDRRAIPDASGVKSVWLEPTPQLLVSDIARWAEQADVRPFSIPGYWYDKDGCDTPIGAPPEEGEKVVLYLHGSAFIALSAYPHSMTGACIPAVLRYYRS
ncbi:predicted protein [Postia placenta Mad-698-R]|nr:predicted protein [Postia placenta Mad-698-R]